MRLLLLRLTYTCLFERPHGMQSSRERSFQTAQSLCRKTLLISTLGLEKVLGNLRQDWAHFLVAAQGLVLRGAALGLMTCCCIWKCLMGAK